MKTKWKYCIQCTDILSGKIGTFMYHEQTPFEAEGKVYSSLLELVLFLREHNLRIDQEPTYDILYDEVPK